MQPRKSDVPVPETLLVGLLLAFVGGFLDAYTYLLHGEVFANAQTGNMVLLFINLAKGRWAKAGYYIIPILAFAMGVWVTDLLKRKFGAFKDVHWRQLSILLELFVLAAVAFMPRSVPDGAINILVSFICAVQVASFSRLHGMGYATTMCTNNLRQFVELTSACVMEGNRDAGGRALKYFLIILTFCVGALACTLLTGPFAGYAILACCLPLSIVWAYLFFQKPA